MTIDIARACGNYLTLIPFLTQEATAVTVQLTTSLHITGPDSDFITEGDNTVDHIVHFFEKHKDKD